MQAARSQQEWVNCKNWEDVSSLYTQLASSLVTKTRYIVRSESSAQDIVHDVFLKLWTQKPRFSDRRKAYSWLYKSTHNAAIDHLRKASNRFRHLSITDSDALQLKTADDAGARMENAAILEKFASRLTRVQLQIVAYRFVDGMDIKAIAKFCDISPRSVDRRLGEAAKILADVWTQEEGI